jgi:hypothetical protein
VKLRLDRFLAEFILLIALCGGVAAQSQADDNSDPTRSGVLSGRVITDNGEPVPNARIFIRAGNALAPSNSATTATDRQGRFQVTGLDPALYSILAYAPGYAFSPREQASPSAYYRIGDSVTVTLIKGAVITGTVSSASGGPMVRIGVRAILLRDVDGQKYSVNLGERYTDDRGVYRFYSLPAGTYMIAAGGRGAYNFYGNAYETDVPVFASSSTVDTALRITVGSGEERSGVDIQYQAEPGHVVSGTLNGPSVPSGPYSGSRVTLTQISNGTRLFAVGAAPAPGSQAFSFHGVGDGDYELTALSALSLTEIAVSEPHRITVKGADVTGLELSTKLLGSISGNLILENSTAPGCKGKRKPLLAETMVLVQNNSSEPPSDDLRILLAVRQVAPDKAGNILFANLEGGKYRLDARYSAKYWYLKSIAQSTLSSPAVNGRSAPVNRQVDVARNWINLKQGERLSGLTVTLAEGAGSLHGSVKLAEGERITPQLYLHLVPSEKDNAEDVLRYFATAVNADGTFALGNLSPGRYWVLARVGADSEIKWASKLRLPDESQMRTKLRKEAEAARTEIEFKPCQNITDYQLSLKPH